MKRYFTLLVLGLFAADGFAGTARAPKVEKSVTPAPAVPTEDALPPPAHFMSTLQLAIHETDPRLMLRSQRLALEQLHRGIEASPQLQGKRYEVRTSGNEVIFYLYTDQDMREPMQTAISDMIHGLNGRVRARGRSQFYRASAQHPVGGYLEVAVNNTHTLVQSIAAQSVPLRDLLKEIKAQMGNVSYLIPGECADRQVDWNFGSARVEDARHLDAVVTDLATLFDLKVEKKNGTYIFSGDCHMAPVRKHSPQHETEILTTHLLPPMMNVGPSPTQVYFPLAPLGD